MPSWGEGAIDETSCRVAVGADLADVTDVADALARFGDRYRSRLFTPGELADTEGPTEAQGLAARFAAKEATFKALGVGPDGLPWRSVEVRRHPGGRPALVLHGEAAMLAEERGLTRWAVSMTHEHQLAGAVVVATGRTPTAGPEESIDHG